MYATLDDLRRYVGLAVGQTADDGLLVSLLRAASRLIDSYTGRHFEPERRTRTYTPDHPARLDLHADLLALHALTNGEVIPLLAVQLGPANEAVKSSIDLQEAAFSYQAALVDGTWGFHPNWASAWADSADSVQDDPLLAGAGCVTVSDAGALVDGLARFQIGQLLQIESEYLRVLAVDAESNSLTVERGVNGTSAAEHALGTAILIYGPPDDVRLICLRVAAWLYRQKDAGFLVAAGGLRGQIVVPQALPPDVEQVLAPYVRLRVV